MKGNVSPAVVGVVVIVIVAIVGFFVWKGTSAGGGLPVGTTQQGNRGKGPLFDWMNHPTAEPKPGYQDAVQKSKGGGAGGMPAGVSKPGGAAAGGGSPP